MYFQKKTLWTDMEKKREYVWKRRGRMVSTHILHMYVETISIASKVHTATFYVKQAFRTFAY